MPSNHLIPYHPLLLLPSIFPSTRVFSNESTLSIRWQKYWSFSFNISPSNERTGLISFRMDWLDLLSVQGTLKSLFWHHRSKASILRHSASFMVQLLNPYMTARKAIALTIRTFVGKVMPTLFNMFIIKILSVLCGKVITIFSVTQYREKYLSVWSKSQYILNEPTMYQLYFSNSLSLSWL